MKTILTDTILLKTQMRYGYLKVKFYVGCKCEIWHQCQPRLQCNFNKMRTFLQQLLCQRHRATSLNLHGTTLGAIVTSVKVPETQSLN